MINDWQTYRLGDFIPFAPEVYFRLIERVNEAFWPLQLVTLAMGLAALALALRGNGRAALIVLAPGLVVSAFAFHFDYYAEINIAAPWLGRAFIAQAVLLAVIAALPGPRPPQPPPGAIQRIVGTAIAVIGLAAWPLISVLAGHGWNRSEVFGLHPDPTAVAALGIVLLVVTKLRAALVMMIPAFWCLMTGLILHALDAAWAVLPMMLAVVAGLTPLAARMVGRIKQ